MDGYTHTLSLTHTHTEINLKHKVPAQRTWRASCFLMEGHDPQLKEMTPNSQLEAAPQSPPCPPIKGNSIAEKTNKL